MPQLVVERLPAVIHIDEQWVSATFDIFMIISDNMVMQNSDLAGPTILDIKLWDKTTLLEWDQKKLGVPLKNNYVQSFLNTKINGSVFLSTAG